MSTVQRAHDSVSRRRTSLGRNPRLSADPARNASAATTPAAPLSFTQNTTAHSSPVWDGRINVQRKRPLRLQHAPPAVPAPAPVELAKTEKDAESSSVLPKKLKKVRKAKASPAERASVTPTEKKNKTRKTATARTSSLGKVCATEDAATLSSTSLSTTPVTTTRSIAFTATDTAASQHDAIFDACRRSNDPNTTLVRNNGAHERQGQLPDEADGSKESGRGGGGNGDVLDVSSQTSSSEESEFDFQTEDTTTSVAATPTSQAVSSPAAAAAAVAPASAPLTAASRTPAESVERRHLSSPSLSAHDHAAAHARVAAAVSAQSVTDLQSPSLTPGRAAASVSSSRSSPPVLEASMTPSPPPAASPASTQQQQRERDLAHAEAASVEVDFVEEEKEESDKAANKSVLAEQLRDDEEGSSDVHTEAAGPVPVIAFNADGGERKHVEAPRSPAAVLAQDGEEKEKVASAAVPHGETTPNEAVKEAHNNEVPQEEDGDRAAVVVVEAGLTTPPPPSAEAPVSLHLRSMPDTAACPSVGVTPASAAASTPVSPSVSPSPAVSRARARLANAPAQPQQQRQKGATPPPPPMASPTMLHRSNSFASPHTHAAAPSPARFSRTSSLAESSPVESSVARRRARRAAVAAAAAATQQRPTTPNNGSSGASALRRSNSEPLNTRAYEAQQSQQQQQQQKSKARSTRESSAASSRRGTPAAPSLASPPPPPFHQHDANNMSHLNNNSPPQQPTALSMEVMDRFIYHAVTVDPPSLNERMEMPPIMERPLSYYEQGMYNRHRLHAPQHYKKALLHEQRALLRNTAWLPMTMMLDQRSGGVGAMMLDDFRHMARVIRYALERENWSAALELRARHEAQCTQLLRAAAAAAAAVVASPPPAMRVCDATAVSSPSAYRGATPSPKKSGYHNKDADAREMSTAAAALGDASVLPSPTKARAAAPASSPSPHKPASTAGAAAQRRASLHNPDYSDSDVEEAGKPPAQEAKAKPASTVHAARGQTAPNAHAAPPAAAATSASALRAASTPAAGMRCTAPGKSATRAASGTTSGNAAATSAPATKQRKGSGDTAKLSHTNKAKDKDKKKEKSESPTFLTWLADAFGVKKNKKTAAKEEKTSPTHHKTKVEGTKAASGSTSKSAAKPDTTRSTTAAASRAEPARKSSSSSAVASKAAAATTSVAAAATTATVVQAPSPSPPLQPPPAEDMPEAPASASPSPAAPVDSLLSSQHNNTTHVAAHQSQSSTITSSTVAATAAAAAAASPFTDDLNVSRFPLRGGRDHHHDDDGDGGGHPVELPPAPIPVFRLFVFHPLEVVQELKRMVWWAAVHRFFVFRVLTGSTAAVARRQQQHGVHSDLCGIDDDAEGVGERVCSVSRRRQQRVAAVVAEVEGVHVVGGGRSGSRGASASPSVSPAHRDEDQHTHSHSHSGRPFHESSSSIDSGAPSVESLDVAAAAVRTDGGGRSHHEAVYFNTVLLNLRVDRWLVRHVLLTRRDAARGVVELEVTEAAEDAAAAAALREEETMEAMHSSAEGGVADKRVASALSYFFCSETRTPR